MNPAGRIKLVMFACVISSTLCLRAFSQQASVKPQSAAAKSAAASSPATTNKASSVGAASSTNLKMQKLPLRRVVLYKSGVGYFEHDGRVRGNEDIDIDLTSGQLDDVLKSLTALDLSGGRITGASYNSQDSASRQLDSLPVSVGEAKTLKDLLVEMRGARLEVRTN